MRLTKLISWFLLCGVVAFLTNVAGAQQPTRAAGRIVVAKVTGSVIATSLADQSQRKLASNDTLTQKYVVTTGGGSSAILVFSNGATLNLGADSTLSIDEFLQDPFEKEVALSDLKEEPTTSTTKLNLSRGELVGNVKHLHEDKGSTFTVNTPVGAAGIRGTTFRIVFTPDDTGKVFFSLQTADGTVVFSGEAAASVHVETGKQITITADVKVDADTGKITITSTPTVGATQDIAASALADIADKVNNADQATKNTVIQAIQATDTNSGGSSGDNSKDTKKDDTKKDDTTKDSSTPSNNGPDTTSPQSNTTPGDGKPI